MSRNLFIFIWLVFLASCDKMDISPAQADTFVKFYNTFPIFTGADVKEIPGKGYVMVGTTVTSGTGDEQICLIRTDLYGNSVDTARYFGGRLNDVAYCIQVLDDGGFAILGSTIDTITGRKAVYFIRTDSEGNQIYDRTIGGLYDVEAYTLKVSAAGSFYMVGYGFTTRGGAALNKDIWLFALNNAGEPLWFEPRYIGFAYEDIGNDLQLLPDGRIVITGKTTNSQNETHAFILKTGSTGFVSSLFTVPSQENEEASCLQVIDENTFVLSGTAQPSGTASRIMMKKIELSLTGLRVIWDNAYGDATDKDVCVIRQENSLHLLATTPSAGINTTITLITTDAEGDNAVYSEIGEGSQLNASSFEMTTDKGFIIAGTNKHSDNDISMALIKVKSDASLQ